MVASHSVKLYGCFRCRGPRFPKKAYTYKSPSRHVLKLAMTTAYFLKKAYNEKALSSLVFSNGSGAAQDALKNTAERFSLRKRGSSHRANFSRSRRERRTNFIVRQKSTEAIAPVLSHYNTSDAVLSSKYERMFVFSNKEI